MILAAGSPRLVGTFKLCISTRGTVVSITMLKSTGFPGYDRTIELRMHDWRYRPFLNNGVAVPGCTSVTVIYHQEILEPLAPKPASR